MGSANILDSTAVHLQCAQWGAVLPTKCYWEMSVRGWLVVTMTEGRHH